MGREMIKILLAITISIFVLTGCEKQTHKHPRKTYYDEIGNRIELTKTPKRVISAAPNLTEIIFSINAGNLLVGRTSFCNYPEEVKQLPEIGDLLHLNFEKIVELKPDLIFLTVEGNTKEVYDKLTALGINVYVTNPRNLDGIIQSIRGIANILNKNEIANLLIDSINSRLKKIKSSDYPKKRAMFIVSISPLIIAGNNTFINEIMTIFNLENIAPKNSFSAYPLISREEVLKKDPEILIVSSSNFQSLESLLLNFPEWKNLKAIKKRSIIIVNEDIFFRPGPRFIDAIEFLGESLKNLKTK